MLLPWYSDESDDQYEVSVDRTKWEKYMKDALLEDQDIILLSRKIMAPQAS